MEDNKNESALKRGGSNRRHRRTGRADRRVANPLQFCGRNPGRSVLNELHRRTIARTVSYNLPRVLYTLARDAVLTALQQRTEEQLIGRAVLNELHRVVMGSLAQYLPGRCALHALVRRAIIDALHLDQGQDARSGALEFGGSTETGGAAESEGPSDTEGSVEIGGPGVTEGGPDIGEAAESEGTPETGGTAESEGTPETGETAESQGTPETEEVLTEETAEINRGDRSRSQEGDRAGST